MGLPPGDAGVIGIIFAGAFIGVGLAWFSHGRDGTISLSSVQLILWTGVVIGSYLGLAAMKGGFLGDLPSSLVELMGISAGSYVTAASTRSVHDRGRRAHPVNANAHRTHGLLSSEADPQQLSIPKLQVFFWTVVAILIYILVVAGNFQSGTAALPDPGTGLVVLMGVSHGAYLGNKFSDNPHHASS